MQALPSDRRRDPSCRGRPLCLSRGTRPASGAAEPEISEILGHGLSRSPAFRAVYSRSVVQFLSFMNRRFVIVHIFHKIQTACDLPIDNRTFVLYDRDYIQSIFIF